LQLHHHWWDGLEPSILQIQSTDCTSEGRTQLPSLRLGGSV